MDTCNCQLFFSIRRFDARNFEFESYNTAGALTGVFGFIQGARSDLGIRCVAARVSPLASSEAREATSESAAWPLAPARAAFSLSCYIRRVAPEAVFSRNPHPGGSGALAMLLASVLVVEASSVPSESGDHQGVGQGSQACGTAVSARN